MASTRPRVVLFDPIPWAGIEWSYDDERSRLEAAGVDLVIPEDHTTRDVALATADVVVVSSIESMGAADIARLERCVGILCYSAGMDAVDTIAAAERGIPVGNLRAGTAEVADHALALLLAAQRRLITLHAASTAGQWDIDASPEIRTMRRLEGQVLGIVGVGAVGRAVAQRARGFGFTIIATYRQPPAEPDPALPHVPLEQLFAEADAIILAASLSESSRGMVDHRVLSLAKPGTILVNVGRGALVVEDDLADALDRGTIGIAALDVRATEPPDPATDRLSGRPEVIQTPHVAGVSIDALADVHRLAAEGIVAMLSDGGRL